MLNCARIRSAVSVMVPWMTFIAPVDHLLMATTMTAVPLHDHLHDYLLDFPLVDTHGGDVSKTSKNLGVDVLYVHLVVLQHKTDILLGCHNSHIGFP